MRKDIFTKSLMLTAILIVAVLGAVSGFSLVFSIPTSTANNPGDSITTTTLQPAGVIGGGTYKFYDDDTMGESRYWYLKMTASGSTSGTNKSVKTDANISMNVTSATFTFCWGSKRKSNNYDHVQDFRYFRLYRNGSMIYNRTNFLEKESNSDWTYDICDVSLDEGSYIIQLSIKFNTGKFMGF